MHHLRAANHRVKPVAIALLLLALAGCGAPPIAATATAPEAFSLTLFTATDSLKYTWLELTKERELRFAGGRDAIARTGEPVTTLTAAQMQEVWDIIFRNKLYDAPAGPLFPESKEVNYDFALNTGGIDRLVRAADNEQPGLRELHDYLFKIQAAIRYDQPRLGK